MERSNEIVYVVYSAECDFRDCILGVFTDEDEADKFVDYLERVHGIGSCRIEDAYLRHKFNEEDGII